MSDDEIAQPLGQRRPTPEHWVFGVQRLLERAPLGVREAHEDSLLAGMRAWRPAARCHRLSDITISGIRTSRLGALHGARGGRLLLEVAGGQIPERRVTATRVGHMWVIAASVPFGH